MRKAQNLFLLCALFISISPLKAEYRVYQYYVKPKLENINNLTAQVVTSTLDPVSYLAYHGGSQTIEINILRSWQCMGNTANKPLCTVSDGQELSELKNENK